MKQNKILRKVQVFILSIFLYMSSNAQQSKDKSNLEDAKKAIAESNAIYFQAFAKGDSSIFIERYAKDCCIMPPNTAAVCGENAALDFFRIAYYQVGLRNGKFITTNVYGDGKEFVTEEGFWQSFDASNKMFDNGKFLVLWKKTPDGWKMFRDSFSSNGKDKN
jgi:ketosteroid isomerase-like protein